MKISPLPSETFAAITASPSSTPIAMMPPSARVAEGAQLGLLDDAGARPMTMNLSSSNSFTARERRDALALLHRDEVGDCLAAAVGPDVGISWTFSQ
jgi:hypothetical protein